MHNSAFIDQDTGMPLRVLIADDIQETRRSTRLMLAMNPEVEVVAIARNGHQSVECVQKYHPDLVIVDINMPDFDGLTAFTKMKEINPDIECIIISAEKDNQALRNAMSVGAREYLVKPFTVDELNLAVHKVARVVFEKRKGSSSQTSLDQWNKSDLEHLADEYAKNHRTDQQALAVFEKLAASPDCSLRWLKILALIYVIRQEWGKLKLLAERLDQGLKKE